ncbi:MAG: amidase family protein [Bacillota bacterium]|nr:amidase family protein [Bacillota bacterium]
MELPNSSIQQIKTKINENTSFLDELGESVSQRCSKVQKKLNAFISFDPQFIAEQIEGIKNTVHNSKNLSLLGVPFALADNISTSEQKTTCASKFLATYQPPFDARVTSILKANGAIAAGKTNMNEFGVGCSGDSSYFKAVKNPCDTKHTSGNGAAAAVLTGAVKLSLASDALGELRQAASYCGVIAIKPTYGRISRRGLLDYASSLEQIGIISNSTGELAAVMETLFGYDPEDVSTLDAKVPAYSLMLDKNTNKIHAAVPEDWSDAPYLQDHIKILFQEQINKLEDLGIKIDLISLPHFRYASTAATIISAVEAFSNLANYDGIRFGYRGEAKHLQEMYTQTRSEGFSSKLKKFLTFGSLISTANYYHDYFLQSQKMRSLITIELDTCLQKYDLLLTPTTPFTAPKLDHPSPMNGELADPAGFYTAAANLAGLPALTFPVNGSGLPFGLHFMAKRENEIELLKTALLLEKEISFQKPEFDI